MDNFKILILHETFEKPLLNRTSDMFYYLMSTIPVGWIKLKMRFSVENNF